MHMFHDSLYIFEGGLEISLLNYGITSRAVASLFSAVCSDAVLIVILIVQEYRNPELLHNLIVCLANADKVHVMSFFILPSRLRKTTVHRQNYVLM
jgi:uncharacterized membrane protein